MIITSFRFGKGLTAHKTATCGPAVLWLHGYTMDSTIWHDMWQAMPGWTHIGLDLPTHGLSASVRGESLKTLGGFIGNQAAYHDVVHIVGLSYGTMLAIQTAAEHPGAFSTLTLGAPALSGGVQDTHAQVRYGELIQLYYARGAGPWMTDLWMKSPPDIFKGLAHAPEAWSAMRQVVNRHTWAELRDGSLQQLASYRQTPTDLARITADTLVLVGEHEMPAFKHVAADLAQHIPRCQTVTLTGAGHLCMLEQPSTARQHILNLLSRSRPVAEESL